MDKPESDILKYLFHHSYQNQRTLSEEVKHSLGITNKSLKSLSYSGYLNENMSLTPKAYSFLDNNAPRRAIILAAGYGMRMVPINMEMPKALLEINGEVMIERVIRQLNEAGINDIYVVVGFMKEKFEYLIDDFGVKLIINTEYGKKNNLYSLWKATKKTGTLSNTYIIPSDIWCEKNPFSQYETYSWYMVSDLIDDDSDVRVNRKNELVRSKAAGNTMIGISYLAGEEADEVYSRIEEMVRKPQYDDSVWEDALYKNDRMIVQARVVHSRDYIEINTYEQLRDYDSESAQLKNIELDTIAEVFSCHTADIENIEILKKGMTNRSFIFSVSGSKYIMRIPGEGTDQLINRKEEAEVYQTISGHGLCDDPVYINPENGYKITKFLNGVRSCDPECEDDLKRCMKKLKGFHDMNLKVGHTFDIFGMIDFYEKLWDGEPSVYKDYEKTKDHVLALKPFIEKTRDRWCLTHIDAVPDNFLFYKDENGQERLQLTDWEYSGMQDPHVDIAMFAIYSYYDKSKVDHLIDIYFEGNCPEAVRCKIYCYVAACGLLWSNWTEFKSRQGVEFGEYGLQQYRYAKNFYRYAREMMAKMGYTLKEADKGNVQSR